MDFNVEEAGNHKEERIAYKPFDNGFERASATLGIISIVTAIMGLATIPLMMGGLAIILALLSRGKGPMSQRAVRGLTCGVIGLTINIALISYIVFLFCNNSIYRQLINNQCEAMYGYTLNEVIESSVGDDFDLEEYLTK